LIRCTGVLLADEGWAVPSGQDGWDGTTADRRPFLSVIAVAELDRIHENVYGSV
jgi:hypothetical protein